MTDSDDGEMRVVSEGGVTVEKSFAAEEFPVPAVKFVLRSTVTEPVTVRLTDEVPESFSMDGIGFHPEYGSDDWNAYDDNRVEYERTLSPGEEVLTVYGVRLEDHDATPADFLDDPALECVGDVPSDVETPDDILGRETTSAVRDALAAGGSLSDAGEEASAGADPTPRTLDDDATPAVTSSGETDPVDLEGDVEVEPLDLEDPTDSVEADVGSEAQSEPFDLEDPMESDADDAEAQSEPLNLEDPMESSPAEADAQSEPLDLEDPAEPAADEEDADAGQSESFDLGDPMDSDAEADVEEADVEEADVEETDVEEADAKQAAASDVAAGSVASALAAEIRAGDVDDEDLEVLRSELEFESVMPKSVDVRLSRIQSRIEDLAAYSDALAEFLDEEGSGQELIESFREDVAAVESELADLESSVSALDDGHESLAADVDRLDGAVDGASDRLDDHDDRLATLDDRVDDARATAETVREDLTTDVADLREDVADLRREVKDLRSFRDRLGDVLGQ